MPTVRFAWPIVVLVVSAACGGSHRHAAQTGTPAEAPEACECPVTNGPLPAWPVRAEAARRLDEIRPRVSLCFSAHRGFTLVFQVDGATGYVTAADMPRGTIITPEEWRCVQDALTSLCFARFSEAHQVIQSDFSVGWFDKPSSAPQCPSREVELPSRAEVPPPPPSEEQLQRARTAFLATYGAVCEDELREQRPMPATLPPSMDEATEQTVLLTHFEEVRACYDATLQGWPGVSGKLAITLVTDASGSVQSSQIERSTHPVPELGCCLRQAMRAWTFPPAARTVHYDLALRP